MACGLDSSVKKPNRGRARSGNSGTHCVDLVQDLPLFVGHAETLSCLDGSLHLTGPHLQVSDTLRVDELTQLLCKLNGREKKCK